MKNQVHGERLRFRRRPVETNKSRNRDRPRCLQDLFEAQVRRTPDAVAVTGIGTTLTFRELDEQCNRLAHLLAEKHRIGPEDRVTLLLERSPRMLIAILSVLKAGGAYLPIDPAYPSAWIDRLLDDAKPRLLITEDRLHSRLHPSSIPSLCLDHQQPLLAALSPQPLGVRADPQNLAYVLYTSGSTGTPKGVMVPHRALANYLSAAASIYLSETSGGAPVHSPLAFDLTITSLFLPLLHGEPLRLLPEPITVEQLAETIAPGKGGDTPFTLVKVTPAHLDLLAQRMDPERIAQWTRTLIVGGDALSGPALSFWRNRAPEMRIFNEYGPTEATVGCCVHEVEPRDVELARVPIGRPLAAELYLLDLRLEPVPVGVPGELFIGGQGLARGYLRRPDLTAERFIPHPFSERPGDRLYRTGDKARYRPDGNLEFLGRVDHQIKIRGFRIEPGEIEAALTRHSDVDHAVVLAVVLAREDHPTETDSPADPAPTRRLVAYLVLKDQEMAPPTTSSLRSFLQRTLPEPMIPSVFVFLPELPLTPNRKIDRKALPAPDSSRPDLDQAFATPRSPTEEILAQIWARILGLSSVGIHDSFFELGGHSLLATQVVSRIRETFRLEIPLRSLFETPTVSQLARSVDEARRHESDLPLAPPIRPVADDRGRDRDDLKIPLSFAQQRLWFLDQLEPLSAAYNMPFALRLRGTLNIDALEQAFSKILLRHEVLRTTFTVTHDGQPRPVFHSRPIPIEDENRPWSLPRVNLEHLPCDQREDEARRQAETEARAPFDLARGPLVRIRLLRLSSRDHVLLLTLHHIVSDGWSMGILCRELSSLYQSRIEDRPSPLPDLPIQYADFAHWQREWLRGDVLEQQMTYWKERLAHLPPSLDLPTDRSRPRVQSFKGASTTVEIPKEIVESLNALAREEGATLFMILLAAFKTLLLRISGQEDLVVGSPIAGRTRTEIEPLIGFFINTLVLRTDLSGNPTFRELVRRVRETALGAYAHQDLPFEKLVEEIQPERDISRTPLFQVMFAFSEGTALDCLELPSLDLIPVPIEKESARFDLVLSLERTLGFGHLVIISWGGVGMGFRSNRNGPKEKSEEAGLNPLFFLLWCPWPGRKSSKVGELPTKTSS